MRSTAPLLVGGGATDTLATSFGAGHSGSLEGSPGMSIKAAKLNSSLLNQEHLKLGLRLNLKRRGQGQRQGERQIFQHQHRTREQEERLRNCQGRIMSPNVTTSSILSPGPSDSTRSAAIVSNENEIGIGDGNTNGGRAVSGARSVVNNGGLHSNECSNPDKDFCPHLSPLRLQFSDYVDLQTRLVLLPRVEEEGTGAIISSYIVQEKGGSQHSSASPKSCTQDEVRDDTESSASNVRWEGCVLVGIAPAGASVSSTTGPSAENATALHTGSKSEGNSSNDYNSNVDNNDDLDRSDKNWRDMDFTAILASIREADQSPITLLFEFPLDDDNHHQHPHGYDHQYDDNAADTKPLTGTPEDISTLPGESVVATDTTQGPGNDCEGGGANKSNGGMSGEAASSIHSGMMALSAWGSRVRAQSEKLAAGAASGAAVLASAAKDRARQMNQPNPSTAQMVREEACDMFFQTSVGAFVPAASAQKVTTSSLLLIRQSVASPCPLTGWSFQWYRSSVQAGNDDNPPVSSQNSSEPRLSKSKNVSGLDVPDIDTTELEWVILEGATHAAFQPDATLVGQKVRCIVTIAGTGDGSSASDDSDMEDMDLNSLEGPKVIVCELRKIISADPTLFNGARQVLVSGANFGSFTGLGQATGRTFRLEVTLGMKNRRKRSAKQVTVSSLKIFQSSGSDSMMLHETPILQATAVADPARPKRVDLVLPHDAIANTMLSALCTDGRFKLESPSRLARESFLYALGIANYPGKPANLVPTTVLFRDDQVNIIKNLLDDDSMTTTSSVSTSSSADASTHGPTTTTATADETASALPAEPSTCAGAADKDRVATLEVELEHLRRKLGRKDKVVSELQRQLAASENSLQQTTTALMNSQEEVANCKNQCEALEQSLRAAEGTIAANQANVVKMREDHAKEVGSFDQRIECQVAKLAELEKANRALQNEKAVLAAAVEARESKLVKMGELQTSFEELSVRVAKHNAVQVELDESKSRFGNVKKDLEESLQREQRWKMKLDEAKETIRKLSSQIQTDEKTSEAATAQLQELQKKNQQLRGERNNYKQKNDSLSKEISRLCRNGLSIREIEKMMGDHTALLEEVLTLRKQKRQALEEAHMYRKSYEQSRLAERKLSSGVDFETRKAVERNGELERLLAEMTEYVNAKEMQLETFKQVNEQLQLEIHRLAQASFHKNDV